MNNLNHLQQEDHQRVPVKTSTEADEPTTITTTDLTHHHQHHQQPHILSEDHRSPSNELLQRSANHNTTQQLPQSLTNQELPRHLVDDLSTRTLHNQENNLHNISIPHNNNSLLVHQQNTNTYQQENSENNLHSHNQNEPATSNVTSGRHDHNVNEITQERENANDHIVRTIPVQENYATNNHQAVEIQSDNSTTTIYLNRRGGINFLPERKLLGATWEDVGVNTEKGEATTLFGLELQAIKVQKLKRLMGILNIRGRKRFQNSKYDMFRCIFDQWKIYQQKKNASEWIDANVGVVGTINGNSIRGVGDHLVGDIIHFATSANNTATQQYIEASAMEGITHQTQHHHQNHEAPSVTIGGSATSASTRNSGTVLLSSKKAVNATNQYLTLRAGRQSQQQQQHSQQLRNQKQDYKKLFTSIDTSKIPPSIATLALLGLNATNTVLSPSASSPSTILSNEEKQTLLHKAKERIESEVIRAEKQLKIDEQKIQIEKQKERREHEKHQLSMIAMLTNKIDELRERKREKTCSDDVSGLDVEDREEEEEEINDMLKYYSGARKRIMTDSLRNSDEDSDNDEKTSRLSADQNPVHDS